MTQPRKLAANELAARVSMEWGGNNANSIISNRFERFSKAVYCTDAKLLNMIRTNPNLDGIDCVIVDEVHERSISTDLLLGCLKGVLRRRPNLRLVLTSATMDRTVFQKFYHEVSRRIDPHNNIFLPGETSVPVVEVPGRTFPVDDYYEAAEEDYVTLAWRKALRVHRDQPPGIYYLFAYSDILIFFKK